MPTVAAVTPADGAAAVQGGTPVRVELTRNDSTDFEKIVTSQADFAAGTLVNVLARASNDLALMGAAGSITFPKLDHRLRLSPGYLPGHHVASRLSAGYTSAGRLRQALVYSSCTRLRRDGSSRSNATQQPRTIGLSGNVSTSPGTITINTWTHCAVTFDGTTARIYINGKPGRLVRTISWRYRSPRSRITVIGIERFYSGSRDTAQREARRHPRLERRTALRPKSLRT